MKKYVSLNKGIKEYERNDMIRRNYKKILPGIPIGIVLGIGIIFCYDIYPNYIQKEYLNTLSSFEEAFNNNDDEKISQILLLGKEDVNYVEVVMDELIAQADKCEIEIEESDNLSKKELFDSLADEYFEISDFNDVDISKGASVSTSTKYYFDDDTEEYDITYYFAQVDNEWKIIYFN